MFAPHTNDLVRHQAQLGLIPTPAPLVLGQFDEAEFGKSFEYAERRWHCDDFAPEMPHIIYVGPHQEARLAKVLKTVAYVVVDEDADGQPVIEKWAIRRHRIYA